MASKLQNIEELSISTIQEITKFPELWMDFLNTAALNYKYSFEEQALIYVQKPEATACADIDTWNKKLHRWIKKGSKGIALLENDGTGNKLKHVFDISDTYDKFGRQVPIWKLNHENDNEIIEGLQNRFGELELNNTLTNAIISTAFNMVEDNLLDYLKEIDLLKKGSDLENLDIETIKDHFRGIVTNSVSYMVLKRCGYNPLDYINKSGFDDVIEFNTIDVISQIGSATSDISETCLREIYETSKSLKKNNKKTIRTFEKNEKRIYDKDNIDNKNERRDFNERDNISSRGGLFNTRLESRERKESEFGNVRKNETKLFEGKQERTIYSIDEQRNTNRILDNNGGGSTNKIESDNQGFSQEESSERRNETKRSNEVGWTNEQFQISGTRDSIKRNDLQLNLFTNNKTEEEQKELIRKAVVLEDDTTAFSFTQEMLDAALRNGSGFENGKFRIYKQFQESLSKTENINFLKNEYGIGGASTIGNEFEDIGIWYDAKGIALNRGYKPDSPKILYQWNKVELRLEELIKLDKYLTKEEKLEYDKWLNKDTIDKPIELIEDNKSLEEKLLDFENEYDIFDTSIEDEDYKENARTLDNIKNDLKDTKSIDNYIKYYDEVLKSEDGQKSELTQKLEDLILGMTNLLEEKKKEEISNSELNKEQIKINYHIDNNDLGKGTLKEKVRRNIDAIKLLNQLENESRLATSEEQKILANYIGWGGLSDVFDKNKTNWSDEYNELKEILTEDEYKKARESTLTAFYTPPIVINSIYKALHNMGLKEANILEPSCGVGNFFGMIPKELENSKLYGVELDNISGRIAKQLYQNANIKIQGFEKADLPDSFFDVAIGNVPFGDFKVNDRRYDKNKFLIHDYFFAKTIDKVRPGGVIAFITSKGTMDKENPEVRKYIAQRADLLGAIRLPSNTFTKNAGTEVTSDIIFLQKRENMTDIMPDWVYLDRDINNITMNKYFVDNSEMILGRMEIKSTRYGFDSTCKAFEDTKLEDLLSYAITNIHAEINDYQVENDLDNDDKSIPADPNIKNYSYTLVGNDIYFRENSKMYLQDIPLTNKNRIIGMIKIRDQVRELIEYQVNGYSDEDIKQSQSKLNYLYDKFSKDYGLINSRANQTAFSNDSSYFLLCSLEKLDSEGKYIGKADIFSKRTINPNVEIDKVDTSNEALILSMSEKARVDLDYMSKLTNKNKDTIIEDLRGEIFKVPFENERYETADEYLSGNVREKLNIVNEAVKTNSEYEINKRYLEQVLPKDISASEIGIKLGSTWIPPEIIRKFMFQLLDTPMYKTWDIKVRYSDINSEWYISNKNSDRTNVKAYSTYGTDRINAYKIIEQTLNLKDVRIFDTIIDDEGKKQRILNKKETAIAQAKQDLIKQEFNNWIWQDIDRRNQLVRLYNDRFNSIVPREFDGSHLNFVGMNPEIKLRKHQLNAIAHILYGNNVLLAHEVGAGKTFEMVAAAMESKRLGLCNKPLLVVPNHIIEQFASEFLQLYPSANILVSTKKDFETKNRKKFCSRIATGEFDAIIIGHSQFEKIPMSVERQKALLEEQINDIVEGIRQAKEDRSENYTIKQMEKNKKTLETKLEKLNNDNRKDDVVTFEDLGVDKLFVDEAHNYKNLFLYTKMRNVGGIAQTEAQKSSDLFMKCRYLDEITGGKGTVFATGTPVSNSMVELYTMQRYLQYDELRKIKLEHFDNWASTFGETITAIELAPEGSGYRAKTRFAKFHNLPELMSVFKESADIQTADTLKLPVPESENHNIVVEASEIQKDMVEDLGNRADKIRNRQVDAKEDNMLKITNEGRKLALDQRLMNPLLEDFEGSKVNICSNNIYDIWNKSKDNKSTQLVFCDLSTPKEFNKDLLSEDYKFTDVYNDLKRKLMLKGIPEEQIAFIHEADNESKKKELFSKVRNGDVRILIGSTQKMGAGTNVQDKLIAIHHLDCPWRPADLTQRNGRMIRQGNTNKLVRVYSYVTEGTFDAYLYQLVEQKQKFISQIMTSKTPMRQMDDIDEKALSYGEIKALATGNPKILEKTNLDAEVSKLTLIKQNFMSQKYELQDKIVKYYPNEIIRLESRISDMERDVIHLKEETKVNEDGFSEMIINGMKYDKKDEAGKRLLLECQSIKSMDVKDIGTYRGFNLIISYDSFSKNMKLALKNNLKYSIDLGTDVLGNITRINNCLDNIESKIPSEKDVLENTKKQFETAKVEVEKEFPQEQELKEKQEKLNKLNEELKIDDSDHELLGDEQEEKKEKNKDDRERN